MKRAIWPLLLLADLLLVAAAHAVSFILRFGRSAGAILNGLPTLLLLLVLVPCVSNLCGLYVHRSYVSQASVFYRTIRTWTWAFVIYVLAGFVTRFSFLIASRAYTALFFGLLLALMLPMRIALIRAVLQRYLSRPDRRLRCSYAGPVDRFEAVEGFLNVNRVAGLSLARPGDREQTGPADTTFLYSESESYGNLYEDIRSKLRPGKPLFVASPLFRELKLGWSWGEVDGIPVYTLLIQKRGKLAVFVRRFIDVIGSVCGIILLFPILLIAALAVRLETRGPVIFKQTRVGLNGREFTLFKLRTMVNQTGDGSVASSEEGLFSSQRVPKKDLRRSRSITRIGQVLRRTSIDEWPQLLNVLKGEMSLVGPRPQLRSEVSCWDEWHGDRLSVKQGLTGLWQVHGRGEMPGDKSVFIDLMYVINRSICLDLRLLVATVPAVLLGRGAC